MTDSWTKYGNLAEQHTNAGGLFVRLANDGDKVVGAFCGEPDGAQVHWTGEKYETCEEEDCPRCAEGKRATLRVKLNLYVPAEGQMKIIEGGSTWFKDVLKVREKYGTDNWLFEIERHGDAGDPKTKYSILPDTKIDDNMRANIAATGLHDLRSTGPHEATTNTAGKAPQVDDSKVIDADTVADFIERLKALPRSDVDAFLTRFNVKRVRDVKAVAENAAKAFLAEREKKYMPVELQEVDPFA